MGTQQNILQQDEESRWACQKQSGKRLILRMDSSSRKIVMTSAHLPGAQWQRIKKGGDLVGKVVRRHRCPCTYWSVMLNSFWQLSNWISNKGQTAKGRISRHVDGEQGVRSLLRLLTPCDHVKFSRDGRWWNSTVKSHHPTHLVHTLRLRPTSGHCSWWEVLERPDHRGPRGNQRIHTRHSGVCSNRITSLFVYICLHKEEKEKDRAGDVPTFWRFDFYSDYADLRYFWVIVQMIIHLLHYWQLGIFLQSDWYCCCCWHTTEMRLECGKE